MGKKLAKLSHLLPNSFTKLVYQIGLQNQFTKSKKPSTKKKYQPHTSYPRRRRVPILRGAEQRRGAETSQAEASQAMAIPGEVSRFEASQVEQRRDGELLDLEKR